MDAEERRPEPEVEHRRRPAALERVPPEAAREDANPLRRLASAVGNEAFTQIVARMREGGGILDGGVVHPDVEGAIAAARGRGRPLKPGLRTAPALSSATPRRRARPHRRPRGRAVAGGVGARVHGRQRHLLRRGRVQPRTPQGTRAARARARARRPAAGGADRAARSWSRNRAMRSSARPRRPRGDSDGAGVAAAELRAGWFHSSRAASGPRCSPRRRLKATRTIAARALHLRRAGARARR